MCAPVKVGVEVDVPPLEKCPTLDEVREVLEAGEEISYKAHMALDYGGMHPNPEEYLYRRLSRGLNQQPDVLTRWC